MTSKPAIITANGNQTKVGLPSTVADFVAASGLKPTQVVVELNGNVLARNLLDKTALANGDRIEIIVPVAGG